MVQVQFYLQVLVKGLVTVSVRERLVQHGAPRWTVELEEEDHGDCLPVLILSISRLSLAFTSCLKRAESACS